MQELSRAQVGQLIANIMERGISIEGLSNSSKVPESVIIMVMKGQLRPSDEVRFALAEALGVKPWLLV